MNNQDDLPSPATSAGRLQAFSAYLSNNEGSEDQHGAKRGGDSNLACCARSIFTLHSSIDAPSAVDQTAVNVSDGDKATGHEDVCCDEQIVKLLQSVRTVDCGDHGNFMLLSNLYCTLTQFCLQNQTFLFWSFSAQ
jgi:hypothetical protein